MTIPKKIILTGRIFIKYIDEIESPAFGDILLYLNDDAINPFPGDYEDRTKSGYIKASVYDGKFWQNMYIGEFCTDKENKFSKKQRAFDSAILCRDIMEENVVNIALFKSYRSHFTRYEYEQNEYDRGTKHGHKI